MCCESDLLRIKKFFCCWNLRLGCFIIGYLGLIANLLQVSWGSAKLNLFYMQFNKLNGSEYFYYTPIINQYLSIGIAYHAISILFNASLVYGVYKNKHELILPWLIQKGLEWLIVVIVIIISFIVYCFSPGMDVLVLFLLIALFIFSIWLVTYTYMCVYSHYYNIKNKENIPENFQKDFPPTYVTAFNIDGKLEKSPEIIIN